MQIHHEHPPYRILTPLQLFVRQNLIRKDTLHAPLPGQLLAEYLDTDALLVSACVNWVGVVRGYDAPVRAALEQTVDGEGAWHVPY